jgi:2'-5' RNA ligase
MASIRVFIGVELESQARAELTGVIERLASAEAAQGLRFADPANLHLTLEFIGSIADTDLTALGTACAEAVEDVGAFEMQLGGLGAFPRARAATTLFVSVMQGSDQLALLATKLAARTTAFGAPRPARRFVPHLTIARSKEPRDLRALTEQCRADVKNIARVQHATLFRSHLGGRGARYEALARFALTRT